MLAKAGMSGFAEVTKSTINIDLSNGIRKCCAYAHALKLGQDHSSMTTPVTVDISIGTVNSRMEANGLVT
jgi:hypothetical protein